MIYPLIPSLNDSTIFTYHYLSSVTKKGWENSISWNNELFLLIYLGQAQLIPFHQDQCHNIFR